METTQTNQGNEKMAPTWETSKDRIRDQVLTGVDSVRTQLTETGKVIRDESAAAGHVIREEASSIAKENLERARTGAADTISRAARGLESSADETSSPRLRQVTAAASHRLDGVSQYVRTKSLNDLSDDVRSDISKRPGAWLLAALGVGFLTGFCYHGIRGRVSAGSQS